ncbi:MAG: hypothetical protein KDD35_13050, partial [Bdellovibrionales bacterium]|nr:hypothetical protein [Bdellovibrionales bacterium]
SGEPAAPPPVVENKCEGDELVQGHLDSCDTTGCQGWGFRYGDIPTIKLVINQSGAYNRQVSLLTTPQSNRGDVNTQLKSQGCMSDSSDSLLTHFSIPAAEIDNKLRSTTPSKGAGTESYFKVSAYVNSKFIGESSYTPLSPIDLPPESANPPPQQAITVSSGGLSVQNVPSGSLLGCFEYDKDYGIGNPPGSCGGAGKTQLIGNGWSYNSSTRTASCNCDSSVFGGRHGKIFFTYYPSLDNGRPGGISPIPIHAQGNF